MNQNNKPDQTLLSRHEISQNRVINDALIENLDEEVNKLDSISKAKLSAARYRALESLESKSNASISDFWKAGITAVASIVVATTLWIGIPQQGAVIPPTAEASVFADLNILASSNSVEFYQSLDFLIWLENESDTNG